MKNGCFIVMKVMSVFFFKLFSILQISILKVYYFYNGKSGILCKAWRWA